MTGPTLRPLDTTLTPEPTLRQYTTMDTGGRDTAPMDPSPYPSDRIARIDRVILWRQAGCNRLEALTHAGYSSEYMNLFRSRLYSERLAAWCARLESELVDHRKVVFSETLALARDPKTPIRERVRMYEMCGRWAGLDRAPKGEEPPGTTINVLQADLDTAMKTVMGRVESPPLEAAESVPSRSNGQD